MIIFIYMDAEGNFQGQQDSERERLVTETKVSVIDTQKLEREMAAQGYTTLDAGTRVSLRVAVEPNPKNQPGWKYLFDVGGNATQAPVECAVIGGGVNTINPDHSKAGNAELELTSARRRRLEGIRNNISAELDKLMPPEDDEIDFLEGTISENPPNQARIDELLRADRKASSLIEREQRGLSVKFLEQNPALAAVVNSSEAGKLPMAHVDLLVGTTTIPDLMKMTPPAVSPPPIVPR